MGIPYQSYYHRYKCAVCEAYGGEMREYNKYILSCDIGGEVAEEKFYSFREAKIYADENGWQAKKEYGAWINVCPECRKNV